MRLEKRAHDGHLLQVSSEHDLVIEELRRIISVSTLNGSIESGVVAELLVLGEYKETEEIALQHYRLTTYAGNRLNLELVDQ